MNATDNNEIGSEYFLFPTFYHPGQFIEARSGEFPLQFEEFYPIEGENVSLSQVEKDKKLVSPGLFLQFKPSSVPVPPEARIPLLPNRRYEATETSELLSFEITTSDKVIALEEVVLEGIRDKSDRREDIRNRTFGKVDFFEPDDPRRNQFLSNYLSGQGFQVREILGEP